MSTFSPSPDFASRWLATPLNIRHTIYQGLEDINTLLQGDDKVNEFEFNTPELEVSLAQMQAAHEAELAEQSRLNARTIQELRDELGHEIDKRVADGLQMTSTELANELKQWLNAVLDERLKMIK